MNTCYQWCKAALVMVSLICLSMTNGFCQVNREHDDLAGSDVPQTFQFSQDPGHGPLSVLPVSQKNSYSGSGGPEMPADRAVQLSGNFSQGNVYIQDSLNIGLEDGAAGYRLAVDGKIMCEELKVQSSDAWPDYVFASDYELLSIHQLEEHIRHYRHLPGVPSASRIDDEGILVGDMQRCMMEKIEELTLYIIAQDKRIAELERGQRAEKKRKG
ncbi:MAG TPA: hypothetical protein VI603_03375 [Saprospiraceae bacterium]|nr:hypothetical protein [Saprospiraceae bacterium]